MLYVFFAVGSCFLFLSHPVKEERLRIGIMADLDKKSVDTVNENFLSFFLRGLAMVPTST
jgi:hypothetical protein